MAMKSFGPLFIDPVPNNIWIISRIQKGSVDEVIMVFGYGKAMLGGHFFWNEGLQNIILEVGGWKRVEKRFYDGSLAQQFLVQLEYQGYFSFPFHRNFSK